MAEIGLSATWMQVAQLLGYEQFMALWRLLSANPALRNDDGQIELRLRPIRAWERYQRNRYIATLVQAGIKPSAIHAMVQSDLGETLTFRQLSRLAAAARARAHAVAVEVAGGIDDSAADRHESPRALPSRVRP